MTTEPANSGTTAAEGTHRAETKEPVSTAEEHGASLVAILEELATLLTNARTMPMSASVLVNRAEALDLIQAAKSVVPDEIRAADGVLTDADATLRDAHSQSTELLERAEQRAHELASEDRVVELAQQRADQLVTEAEERAHQLARDANDYCDRQLAQFEIDLSTVATQVRAGRDRLAATDEGRDSTASATQPPHTR